MQLGHADNQHRDPCVVLTAYAYKLQSTWLPHPAPHVSKCMCVSCCNICNICNMLEQLDLSPLSYQLRDALPLHELPSVAVAVAVAVAVVVVRLRAPGV
jgi:hypothetical protein